MDPEQLLLATLEKIFNPPYENLNKEVRARGERYSASPYAGMCWILEAVLGIEPETVCLDGFDVTAYSYQTFMFDRNGKRLLDHHTGHVKKLSVSWTAEQKRLIHEWWEYIPPELKNYGYSND